MARRVGWWVGAWEGGLVGGWATMMMTMMVTMMMFARPPSGLYVWLDLAWLRQGGKVDGWLGVGGVGLGGWRGVGSEKAKRMGG